METKIAQAEKKAHYLDEETQALLHSVKRKNSRATTWFVVCFMLLFLLGSITYLRVNQSITKQNQIAAKNQQHIDCIVKLFTTPLPATAKSRTISNPSTTCNINFN